MVAAGIYLAYTGFDLTRAVIGSSEKNKWVFLAFAVLFLVFGATVIVMNVRGMIQDYKDGRREKKSEEKGYTPGTCFKLSLKKYMTENGTTDQGTVISQNGKIKLTLQIP